MNRGSIHHKVKQRLTAHDVIIIRRLYRVGFGYSRIAKAYQYSPQGILGIVRGLTWKHVH